MSEAEGLSMDRKHNSRNTVVARMLRKNMTKEERHLWYDFLRTHPARFTRQKVLGKYVVDFYSPSAKLVIELDGSQHFMKKGQAYDEERTTYLEQYGLTVLRFANNEVMGDFQGVCEKINLVTKQSPSQPFG